MQLAYAEYIGDMVWPGRRCDSIRVLAAPNRSVRSRDAVCCADLRVSNVMELNTKDKTHADSTMEASLSQNDLAGREAALSFSGEEMTKAAKKRYPSCWLLRALLASIASHLASETAGPLGCRSHLKLHAK